MKYFIPDVAILGNGLLIDSFVNAGGYDVPANITSVILMGYYEAGDGGEALYRKVDSEPTTTAKFQSASGDWFTLAPCNTINVKQFGAKADGFTIDSGAIQNACRFADNITIEFPYSENAYVFDESVELNGQNGITIDFNYATIMGTNTRIVGGYFDVSSASNITFKRARVDQMQNVLPVYTEADYDNIYNAFVYADGGWENISVTDCLLYNLYTIAIYGYQGSGFTSDRNIFIAPVCNQTYKSTPACQNYQHHYFISVGGEVKITNNDYLNAPITNPALGACSFYISGYSGNYLNIENNYSEYAGRDNTGTHRLGCIDFYADVINARVVNNTSYYIMGENWMRCSSTARAYITGNQITVSPNAMLDGTLLSIEGVTVGNQKGCQDIQVYRNRFIDDANRYAVTVGLFAYDWDYPLNSIWIEDNEFKGCRKPFLLDGCFLDVGYINNSSRNGAGVIQMVTPTQIATGTEADSTFTNLFIEGNTHYTATLNQSFIDIVLNDIGGSPTTATVGYFLINNNTVRNTISSTGQGIACFLKSSDFSNTDCDITKNDVAGYEYSYYVRTGGHYNVESNKGSEYGTAPLLNDNTAVSYNFVNNKWANGVLFATATLGAGGTVALAMPEAFIGDKIFINRKTVAGTPGFISYTIPSNGTVNIVSTDAGDNSVFDVWVVH